MSKLNYLKIEKTSVANGVGVRVVLWVSGCTCHCKCCQNPQSWDFNSGSLFDENAKKELFESLNKPYIQGITFSGGHPLEPENVDEIFSLIHEIKERFPKKDIWLYTGYTWESIMKPVVTDDLNLERDIWLDKRREIVLNCDIVVDGSYIDELKDITLKWRGSSNQRVIDVKKTLTENKIVLYNN